MKRSVAVLGLCILSACGRAPETAVEATIDPQLAREIAQTKAIDHHAHPVRPTSAGEAPDTDYDALPVETLAPQSDPIRMRADSAVTETRTPGPTADAARVAVSQPTSHELKISSAAQRRAGLGQPVALMVVGGAALLTGLIIGDDAGTVIAVGGALVGLYGLYEYLQ